MKHVLVLSVLMVSLLSADWQRVVGSSDTPAMPDKKVMRSDSLGVYIRTTVFGFVEEDTTIDNKTFKRIEIPGELVQRAYQDTTLAGRPQIPYVRLLIAVPDSAELDIAVKTHGITQLADYFVYPMPLVVFEDTADIVYYKEIYTYDTTSYQQDALYPGKFCEINNDGHWRDQRVLEVFLYPVQYNPEKELVYLYSLLDLIITYSGTAVANENGLGPFEAIGRETLLNYPGIDRVPGSVPEPAFRYYTDLMDTTNVADYLIVMGTDFYYNETASYWLEELARWRVDHNGFSVGLVKMEDVYSSWPPADSNSLHVSLRDFLAYAYDYWPAPAIPDGHFAYCLLVGDWDHVPTEFYWWGHDYRFYCVTEGYFRDIDSRAPNGLDDIMLGRWPVKATEVEDLVTICRKTLDYEQKPCPGDWRRRGLLISGPNSGSDALLDQAGGCFADISYDTFMVRWRDYAGPGIHPELFLDTIHACLNAGEILAAWYGHGTFDYWTAVPWTVGYSTAYAETLQNGDALPVVLSYACLTAAFQWDHPEYDTMPGVPDAYLRKCLGECFLFNPDGGAVAWYGGSALLWMNTYTIKPFRRVLRYQNWILGQALINAVHPNLGHDNGNDYCLLGDPALDLGDYTAFPNFPDLVIRPKGIDVSFPPPYPYPSGGDSIPIRAKVLNIGARAAEDVDLAVTVKLGIQDLFKDTITIDEIKSRDSVIATIYWPTATTHPNYCGDIGNCDLVVEVDPASEITESWERNNGAQVTRRIALYPNMPGWPRKVVGFSQPALGNLDDAAAIEIVYVGHDSIYVFAPDTSIRTGWPQYFQDVNSIALADLDCAGQMEIIALSPESVTVYDNEGNIVTGWPQCVPDTSKRFWGFPALGYVSGSKKRQVVVYVGGPPPEDEPGGGPTQSGIMVYDYDGDSLYYLTRSEMYAFGPWSQGPSIADVNNDGKEEIIVSYEYHYEGVDSSFTAIFNRDGHVATLGWGSCLAISALADLNDDGTADLVTGCADSTIRVYDAARDSLIWVRQTEGPINSSPAVGDFHPAEFGVEITLGNDKSRVHLLEKGQGASIDPWPYITIPSAMVRTSPAIADINGDEHPDVIFGASNGYVYALDYYPDTIAPYPLPLFGIPSSPIISDIDGDKLSELVVVSSDGYLHVWKHQASDVAPYALEWPQFHHDYQRTGLYNWISGLRGGDANPEEFSTSRSE